MEVESKALEVPCVLADVEVWSSGALDSCRKRVDAEVWSSGALEAWRSRGIEVWSSGAQEARSERVGVEEWELGSSGVVLRARGRGCMELWRRAAGMQT